jgi:hypothetical protein
MRPTPRQLATHYLRFLLPMVTLSVVLAAVGVTVVTERVVGRLGTGLAYAIAAAVCLRTLRTSEAREAFALRTLERRFSLTADTVVSRLPREAVAITVWPSGAIRFGSNLESVMWDALAARTERQLQRMAVFPPHGS